MCVNTARREAKGGAETEGKQKENPVGCIGEGKRWKINIREGSSEGKMETIIELR